MAKCDNKYIPKYVPNILKWYERDGLETWHLQIKCNDFIINTDEHFKQMKITNFDIFKNNVCAEKRKQYQPIIIIELVLGVDVLSKKLEMIFMLNLGDFFFILYFNC